ncbi:MAG: trypsin-like peptidase domain-containing protein [Chloroflexi bacterium]|nr:trypsin-like peptidase domain-containing protein [Chloroflexota bacterium]
MEERGGGRRWIWRAVMAAFLAGLIGGGLAGGSAGYLLSRGQASQDQGKVVTILPTPAVSNPLSRGDISTIEAVKRVAPAVVTIFNTLPSPNLRSSGGQQTASGSGVIVSGDGYIATNYHVVASAQQLNVVLADGQTLAAETIGTDWPFTDIAVIKVKARGLPVAQIGDSDALVVGQQVLAIGSALGDYRNTVTQGIISGLNRTWQMNDLVMENVIQTDAAINHGNSGGGLINSSGELIGINTSVIRRSEAGDIVEGIGFAIPSNTVRMIVEQIIQQGKVSRPFLGISNQTWTPSLAYTYNIPIKYGVLVTTVSPNSPADKVGIKPNDILFKIGDDVMDERHPFLNLLMKHKPGERVNMVVFRDGKELTLDVLLTEK